MLEIIKLMLEYIEINNAPVPARHYHFVRKGQIEQQLKKLAKALDTDVIKAKQW